ncbi:MAG: hypothetical protein V5A15_00350 [Haloarcula sp.]
MTSGGTFVHGEEPRRTSGETSVEEQLGEELEAVVSSDETDETDGPSLDLVFTILKNSRRRKVIEYLRQRDERSRMGDLAEHIAAIENDTEPRMLTSKQRKRVYVALYQCHLPTMDDADVVDFDADRGTIEFGEKAREFEAYLKAANLVSFLRR